MNRLKGAIAAIENYKDTEEMDSLAFAEIAIEKAKALVEAGSKAGLSNQARPAPARAPCRFDEKGNNHGRPETQP